MRRLLHIHQGVKLCICQHAILMQLLENADFQMVFKALFILFGKVNYSIFNAITSSGTLYVSCGWRMQLLHMQKASGG
ncbi:MAG: hypothetical protein H7Y41_05730 [Hyphomonadaceae bacterium]|nr:hypothetical protein [Clostridia bacterium]